MFWKFWKWIEDEFWCVIDVFQYSIISLNDILNIVSYNKARKTWTPSMNTNDHHKIRVWGWGVMVNVINCGIVVIGFELQSNYYVHFFGLFLLRKV